MIPSKALCAAAGLVLLLSSACATADVAAPTANPSGTLTVDASASWVYVDLREGSIVVPSPSADVSNAWDIGFSTTNVAVNGGSAGPAGVGVYCACQNASATTAQLLAMTPESEKADFDAVTAVPTGAAFTATGFDTDRWYRYNLAGDNRITPSFDVYLVKRGTTVYKVQILNYYSTTGQPRNITFRYERIAQ